MATPPVNVPDVPGVPAVNFVPAVEAGLALLTEDAVALPSSITQVWGIYQNGAPVVEAESVIAFAYKQEWAISDYPVEQGGFGSYDKVYVPFDVRFRFAAGGSEANREALLASIAAIAGTLDLYDIVTPEKTYPSANIVHYDYRRTATNGLGLLQVDLWCVQVKVTGSATFASTQQPNGAAQVNGGTVQASTPTAAEQEALGQAGVM